MRRLFCMALVFLAVAVAADGVAPEQELKFRVTQVRVEVSEREYTGTCPHRFEFTGYISANGAGTVRYRWLRSDGARASEETTVFAGAGTKIVRASWELGSGLGSYRDYWRAIEILAPDSLVSDRAVFTLNCQPDMRVALPTYEISGTIDTGPHGHSTADRQVRVKLTDGRNEIAHQVLTLDEQGRAEYRFGPRLGGRYFVMMEKVPYTGDRGPNVCYRGTTPAHRMVELSATNRSARDQNFTIEWVIAWDRRGSCW